MVKEHCLIQNSIWRMMPLQNEKSTDVMGHIVAFVCFMCVVTSIVSTRVLLRGLPSPKIIKLGKERSPLLVDSGCYWQSHLAASGKDERRHAYREELEDFFVPSDETGIEMMWLLSKMLL